jgi:hypothetical protein
VGYWSIGRLMAALGAAQNGAGVVAARKI